MYPDVLIMCSPMECIPPYTLHSILKFAPHSKVILYVSSPIHMDKESLLQKRLNVLEKATSEYVVFLDADDAFETHIPSIERLKSHEAHLFHCYDMDSKSSLSPRNNSVYKLFGFHFAICKRELALNIFREYQKEHIYRDDVCFLYGILTQAKTIKYYNVNLTMKVGSRLARYAPKYLKTNLEKEVKFVWKPKFKELSVES